MEFESYKQFWNDKAATPESALAAVDGSASEEVVQITGRFTARQVATALELGRAELALVPLNGNPARPPRKVLETSLGQIANALFGDVELLGLTPADPGAERRPGDALPVTLLWQALRSTQSSSGVAQEEISALLGQIEVNMTQDQLDAIRDMQLTNTDMQTWAAENGITMGTGGGQGAGKNLSPEARATRQAEEGRTPSSSGGSGGSAAIIDALISALQTLTP